MSKKSLEPDLEALLDPLLSDLPPGVSREARRWILDARRKSPKAVESQLLLEAQELAERFRLAAAALERTIGR